MCRILRTNFLRTWLFVTLLVALLRVQARPQTSAVPAPPSTPVEKKTDTIHGVSVSDPYQWLEDASSPSVRSWIAAQQKYTASLLDHRPEVDGLRKDVMEVTDIEEAQRVLFRAGRYYILKKLPGREIASLYMRTGEHGKEELLIDPNAWSTDHSDTIELLNASQDGKIIAYSVRHGGRDQVSIHFYNVDARHDLPDQLPEARYIYWAVPLAGSRAFYVKIEDAGPRLYEHKLGTRIENDRLIFGSELGPEMILYSRVSEDGSTLLIHALRGASGAIDVYLKDLPDDSAIKPVVKGIEANFWAEEANGRLYIQTNWQAPQGRIVVADVAHPEVGQWRTLVAEDASTLENFHVVGRQVAVELHEERALRITDF